MQLLGGGGSDVLEARSQEVDANVRSRLALIAQNEMWVITATRPDGAEAREDIPHPVTHLTSGVDLAFGLFPTWKVPMYASALIIQVRLKSGCFLPPLHSLSRGLVIYPILPPVDCLPRTQVCQLHSQAAKSR
jgi:hypothetical protein